MQKIGGGEKNRKQGQTEEKGGWVEVDRDGWTKKLNTNDFIHLILLGYPGVIQLLFVFKDKIDFYMATRH